MEKYIFDLIEKISKEHSNKVFGYLTKDDLKNEIWVICLQKLKEYKGDRGELENFLRSVVHNRLVNRFKDITKSVRSPCPRCEFYDKGNSPSDCSKFGNDRHLCKKWNNFQLSVNSRNSLLNASEQKVERKIDNVAFNKMISEELTDLIKADITKEYLHDYNQLISGGNLSNQKMKKLKKEIMRILEISDYNETKFTNLTIKGK